MKLLKKSTLFVLVAFLAISIIALTNNVKAATSGHYTYEEKSDGTIEITKYDGTAAENLVIPSIINGKTVTSIGDFAFQSCRGLTGSLTIPNSVTSIGKSAFYGCRGLTGSLTIGNSVTSIGDRAFEYCSGLTGSLTIPNSVTSIGNFAFFNCSGLTGSLTIPNSVTSIGSDAFYGCSGLTEIKVLSGNSKFSSQDGILFNKDKTKLIKCPDGNKLNNYSIPNSVTSIEDGAFYNCRGLTGSLTIPNSVTSIENYAFYGCRGLTEIKVLSGNSKFSSQDGILFNKDKTELIQCPGGNKLNNYSIPNSVTSIGYGAFKDCSGLTGSLTIGNSVTSIGSDAFYNCSGLTGSLTIGNSVTSIGNFAFYNCSGLTGSLTIPNSVTSIGEYAFEDCSGLTGSLTIPNSVTSIGYRTFDNCSGLTGSLTIPNSVTSIGDSAFDNCSGLTGSLTIPNSVTSIGERAFYNCRGLMGSLTIPNSVTSIGDRAFDNCSGLTGSLTIGNSVTSIGKRAFYGCSGLTGSLTIPNSVTSIGSGAFFGCSGLAEIKVLSENSNFSSQDGILFNKDKTELIQCPGGNKLNNYSIPNSVTSIGYGAFKDCSGLTGSLTIGNSVTSIGRYAFEDCSGLTGSLTIGNSVTSIGEGAFYNCRGLTGSLTIPNSVTSIGYRAFCGCSGLTGSLTIPNSVTSIGNDAFRYCSGLTGNLTIPNSVTSIGYYAFYNCKNINKIIFVENAPKIHSYTFSNYPNKIYYRKGTTGYTQENGWPASQLAEYDESLKQSKFTINSLELTTKPKIELNSTLSSLVDANFEVVNPSIAKVEKKENIGYITPLANGTTDVKVLLKYSDSVERTLIAKITVDIKATSISLSQSSYTITANGQTPSFTPKILPANTNNKTVKWTSSNTNVATVNERGTIVGVGNGECNITATTTDGTNLSTSIKIIVDIKATSISIDKPSYVFNKNETIKLVAKVLPENTNNKTLKWESSDKNVAIVNSSGMVSPVGKGTCTITATTTDGTNKAVSCYITSNVDYLKGDINKDGIVDVADVTYGMYRFSRGILTEDEENRGNVNGDDIFDVADVLKIMRYLSGKISSLD